ncbi:hypothetical protein BpHYR1_043975 [Brachionus plicatilis]|uniref:Uncharacterized protein n=1 Tax=Brachionus plicatilis TaxID=10195 RepID=A0A3M7Q2V2_BRAPC|nr:hypothetical protein BpHYR1_043975 [Brachionus plicatilis]
MNSYESAHLASYANKFSGLSQPLFAKSPDCNSLVHDADSRSPMSPIDKIQNSFIKIAIK